MGCDGEIVLKERRDARKAAADEIFKAIDKMAHKDRGFFKFGWKDFIELKKKFGVD